MQRLLFSAIIIFLSAVLFSQNRTVGTLNYTEDALEGYTFFSPFSGRSAYMVDNCGNLINRWEQGTFPGLAAYFLASGKMLRTYKVTPIGPFTSASNAGGVALVDWNNNTTWSYELNTDTELSHHDAVMMPNGNILLLTWELILSDELIENGRDPGEIAAQGYAWGERIIEIKPIGSNEVEIIWEWHIKDHWVQDQDATLNNFGVIKEHPELFNINFPGISFDYNHFNAIDYHEAFDQILISSRNTDEIWILDHSTTTAEAASHTGGNSGMGGDIMYRWGNGLVYEAASIGAQRFFGQHGAHWIKDGPDKDKILVFNNGNGRPGIDFSTVEILNPPILPDGNYEKVANDPYGPAATVWVYGNEPEQQFYSKFLSNAQYLENGNILINAGSPGNIFEINPDKEIVWEYEIPLFGDTPAMQGDNINNNSSFRAYKFPLDFKGFEGIDIMVRDPIEIDPIPLDLCQDDVSTATIAVDHEVEVICLIDHVYIQNNSQLTFQVKLFNSNGVLIKEFLSAPGRLSIPNGNLSSGLYFISFVNKQGLQFTKKVLF